MERLRHALFEDPLYIYITLAFVELVLAVIWRERRGRKLAMLLAIPPVLAGIVLLVSWQVVTDRERIVMSAQRIARDLEAGKIDAAAEFLAKDYTGLGGNRSGAIATAGVTLKAYPIERIKPTNVDVAVEGPNATMRAKSVIHMREGGLVSVEWRVRWAKRPEGWRIVHVQTLETRLGL